MTDVHGEGHGNTVAAWTAVAIMMVGATVAGAAVWFAAIPVFWVGIGIVVVGAITGKVLAAMGYGKQPAQATDAASTSA